MCRKVSCSSTQHHDPGQGLNQGLYGSTKTRKVMEFITSITRPEKSRNFSEGHGKSWKSNMLSENEKAKTF